MSPWRHVHLTVSTTGPETRSSARATASSTPWRLEGYAKGESKKAAHSSVAMRVLEADRSIVRIVVRPA
jgi:hypothetical protein